ncbi:MAG: ATP-dependent helicase [Desulfotomaculum sp. BICA1-6]|nr:MAG: ATP-dependent helicase [Desulfotomaculum sp. BICA1-6]
MAEWTREQLDAIEKRDRQMLVSAAAGSGKTSVLVERIIRRITDSAAPVDVDRLLVVTFTSGAAAEMRERIGRAINAALEHNPGSAHLRRQLALLQRSAISTIHSFCLDVIRQHFYRLELDPLFRVMDETEAALLQLDVLDDVLEQHYASGDAKFLRLADCYGGSKDDGGVQELVLQVFKFSRSTPRPDAWLKDLPGAFAIPEDAKVDQLPWFNVLRTSVRNEIAAARGMVELAVGMASRPGGPAPYLIALEKDLALLDELAESCAAGWETLYRQFSGLAFAGLARCRKEEADGDLVQSVKKTRDMMKRKIQGLQRRYFHRPPVDLLTDLRSLAEPAQTLAELVRYFASCYRQAKLERGVVDFNDLENYTLDVLADRGHTSVGGMSPTYEREHTSVGGMSPTYERGHTSVGAMSSTGNDEGAVRPSPVALELRQRFVEVLVDEYQDINAVQEIILNLLTGVGEDGPGLFMVGDVKQSIYRFRLAEPGLFLAKYNRFSNQPDSGLLVNLARNFRSRRSVVEAVNHVFRQIMTPAVGEMEYDQRAELAYGAEYPPLPEATGDAVELLLIDNTPDDTTDGQEAFADDGDEQGEEPEQEEELDNLQVEARTVARRIIKLVESGHPVYDRSDGGYRPVTYRDVVVLMRATSGRANTFVEEFRKLGVPAYAELTTGYFEATEVETMLSLLKVIDNPRQDVPLAAVLRSSAAGFNSEDLARIRLAGGSGEFYDALEKTAREGADELAQRLNVFLRQLDKWRTLARQSGLPVLIWALYRETGYYDYVGGLPGGSQRQANLRALYQRAGQFESTAYRGLFRFLRFVERLRQNEGDMGTARALGENENVVRIMSIHKSKGLEFPVVIVSGLGKKFNVTSLNKSVLLHRDMGLGPQLVDPEKRITYPTVAKLAVREKIRSEELAEEMRLFYVALTRAKEKLILVGSVSRLKDAATRWCGVIGTDGTHLPVWMTAQAVTYLDWLCPALAGHPDGAPLRKLAGLAKTTSFSAGESASHWLVRLTGGKGLDTEVAAGAAAEYRKAVLKMQPVPLTGPRAGAVETSLNWFYPQHRSHNLAARATVTALKRIEDAPSVDISCGRMSPTYEREHTGVDEEMENRRDIFRADAAVRPAFVQRREGLTAAGRGVALHLVMQLLNLDGDLSADGVRNQIALLVDQEQVLPEQAAVVDPEAVAEFFCSPLGRRVLAGYRVYREQPFTVALPLKIIYPDTEGTDSGEDTVLVQGIIDCLVEEASGLLVVDYKTDYYTPETLPKLVESYQYQVDLYSRAAATLTGLPVTARYLYLFYRGEAAQV